MDRLGDQVLNPPRPRARIPLGPRNQLHQFYQGYPTDSDSDDDEDDEDDEDYDDYLMAAPNTVPAVPGQAIGPAIEGANWTVDGTGNLAALTGEGKESAAIQDEMAAAAQTAAAGYGASTSKPPGLGVVRDEVSNDEFGMSSSESSSVSPQNGVEVGP